jgi:nitrite reductase/ring-hydroxylating ferredoxin subunit
MTDTQPSAIGVAELPDAVRAYRPRCPGCSPQKATAEGARPCSYYDCPGLPPELQVTCNLCMYDFSADDGQPTCDHSTCETARRLKGNVPTYRAWLQLLRQEAAGGTE